jgi:hypothetical protein
MLWNKDLKSVYGYTKGCRNPLPPPVGVKVQVKEVTVLGCVATAHRVLGLQLSEVYVASVQGCVATAQVCMDASHV